jgi:hypothetical protein
VEERRSIRLNFSGFRDEVVYRIPAGTTDPMTAGRMDPTTDVTAPMDVMGPMDAMDRMTPAMSAAPPVALRAPDSVALPRVVLLSLWRERVLLLSARGWRRCVRGSGSPAFRLASLCNRNRARSRAAVAC